MDPEQIAQKAATHAWWPTNGRVLVAVSTGVDSMVLLHLLEQLRPTGLTIGVAHVNHQLRAASMAEARFLTEYCHDRELPFYMATWEDPAVRNIEAQARDFRYAFFKKIMAEEAYPCLVTAHHLDDQVETMLMKMIRTGEVFASSGMQLEQPFNNGKLIRPLLHTPKETIIAYAQKNQLIYYEDETNQSDCYQRNRLRQQVLPALKLENPQAFAHFQQISEQLLRLEEWLAQQQAIWREEAVVFFEDSITIDLTWYAQKSTTEQTYFLADIIKQGQEKFNLTISHKQIQQVQKLLAKKKPQWRIDLTDDWEFSRQYEQLLLQKKKQIQASEGVFSLKQNQGIYLTEDQWVGLFLPGQEKIPEKVKDWSEYRQTIKLDLTKELTLRKRQPGDRIALSSSLTKRLSRYLIDQKIPQNKREDAWVLCDENETILALLPYMLSYLSIPKETDKIHYVLLYKYQK
ncbi:MAG: tRNA lysidine(34) synthetase TilS [Enterococcus lemanii]